MKQIIVTGGAGFIGSNLIKRINSKYPEVGITVVDNLTNPDKFSNLVGCDINHYIHKDEFLKLVKEGIDKDSVDAVIHLGACSDTTEQNGEYVMSNNYNFTATLLAWALTKEVGSFIYASSAAVYGNNMSTEHPINVYGYSKYLIDHLVKKQFLNNKKIRSQIVGLRYFNVYGPGEQHKGKMASMIYKMIMQYKKQGHILLYKSNDERFGDGDQSRDFIYVDDVVDATLFFLENGRYKGIFDVGTGKSSSFNEAATHIINYVRESERDSSLSPAIWPTIETTQTYKNYNKIRYIPFPDELEGKYQNFTVANSKALAEIYEQPMMSIKDGIKSYIDQLYTTGKL